MASQTPHAEPQRGPRLSQLALPRAAVRCLAATAQSGELCPELGLDDAQAYDLFIELGGARSMFTSGELRCAAFRTLVVDQIATAFFERRPDAVGVGIWPLLGTRGHRLGARWIDVDAPAVAELRARFLPSRPGWTQQASCLCSAAWIDSACAGPESGHLFVMDEAVLPLHGEVMMRVLDAISRRASAGSEAIVAYDAYAPLRPVRSHPHQQRPALELSLRDAEGQELLVRYPRLRVISPEYYAESLRTSVEGINAVARLQKGVGAPAFMHVAVV